MTRALLGSLVALCTMMPAASAQAPSFERVAKLDFPVGLQFTASGDRLFVNERSGRIRVLRDGKLDPEPFQTIKVHDGGEGGLLGLALHPDFERGQDFVYVFYTDPKKDIDRVERTNGRGERTLIIAALPAASIHHGGILAFGPDRKLYVSHGDHAKAGTAQDPRALGGKIYRINDDGTVPEDNPFKGERTFAYGIRNPFGLAFDPQTGALWESENGPQDHDEINVIVKGRNYGWPLVRGRAGSNRFVDPVVDYKRTIVPTGLAFAQGTLPGAEPGDLFLGTFGEGSIRRLRLNDDRTAVVSDEVYLEVSQGVVALIWGPDGLYFTSPDGVYRVRATDVPRAPPATGTLAPEDSAGSNTGLGALLIGVGLAAGLMALFLKLRRR